MRTILYSVVEPPAERSYMHLYNVEIVTGTGTATRTGRRLQTFPLDPARRGQLLHEGGGRMD